ncbi:C-Myc-binding protein homolog [Drosophila serrata]|uniref:C-Myc-binding protein homolog n=1 Tax=Drosophila serrata TaxID=7274 RepID=UPI000A1CF4EC|nr:C-Myc-binding protein homolog [Drosophila serrata]
MSFKPIDPKRDEIRRYLERGSVLDSLTKIFIRVIKERPENPMEYIRNNIGVVRHQHDKYERLQQDLQLANEEIQRLRGIINDINPDMLQGHQPVLPAEAASDISEAIADPVPMEEGEKVPQQQQEEGDANQAAGESAADVEELTTAVEASHIEEKPVATANESAAVAATAHPTSASVQAEASSSAE